MLQVRRCIISSKALDDVTDFSWPGVWVGTIGGSALPTDADPNTTPPSAGRIVQVYPRRGSGIAQALLGTRISIVAGVVAASSITFQSWVFMQQAAAWFRYSTSQTIAPAGVTTNAVTANLGNMSGARIFVQITANTLVQAVGYGIT
jgi:hypothetical protein